LAALISLAQIYISVRQAKIDAGNAAIDEFYSLTERRRFTGNSVVALWREGADQTQARKAYDDYTAAFTDQQIKRFNVLNFARRVIDADAAEKSPEYLKFQRIYEDKLVGCLLGPQRQAIFRSFTCRYSTSLTQAQQTNCADPDALLRNVPVRGRCFAQFQDRLDSEQYRTTDVGQINAVAVGCLAGMRDYLSKRNDEQSVILGLGSDLSSLIKSVYGVFGGVARPAATASGGLDLVEAQCMIDALQGRALATPRRRTLPDADLPVGPP
jgi:hypothetical protein